MRSRMVFQVGLVAIVLDAISIAMAGNMPSREDMVLIPKGEFTMGSHEHVPHK